MSSPIEFYFACPSPWSYLALDELRRIGDAHGRPISYKPIDVERAWAVTGAGRVLGEKPPVLQDYRHLDLPRWAEFRGVEIDCTPKRLAPENKFFTSKVIIAARQRGDDVYPLTRAFMRACWIQNRDISDPAIVAAIASEAGYDGNALADAATAPPIIDEFAANTEDALRQGAWSVPSIVVDGELFYGQDRLEMIARRLAQ